MNAIEVKHLSFAYQDFSVLQDVNFVIQKGEFVGIIGPNGGGKTTLLKLMMGFLTPNKGVVTIFGKSPDLNLSDIAYVPQTGRFDKQFPISVMEVVLLGRLRTLPWYGKFSEKDKLAAESALKKMGLLEIKNRAFGDLSGGQAQRTLMARALVSNPKILLLDEPTASVDTKTQNEIYELLKNLSGEMTIVMVTHDLTAAIHSVQKVLCVQHNVMELKPNEVCEHFALGLYHSPLLMPKKGEK